MVKFEVNKILWFLALLICLVVFIAAFNILPVPGVCELFPYGKETLVRYYTCSVFLCSRGCPSNKDEDHPVNQICLERDCTTRECKKECNSFCFEPPSEWPQEDEVREKWFEGNAICGRDYWMDLVFESEVVLKGKYCASWLPVLECTDYNTEVGDILINLNKIEPDDNGFPFILDPEVWHVGVLKEEGRSPFGGIAGIYMFSEEVYSTFNCIETDYLVLSFDQCLYRGNLKLWSTYTEDALSPKVDAIINTSIPSPGYFELYVTPCDGKDICNGNCERIILGEEACFDVKVINNLGTDSGFNFDVKCIEGLCDHNGVGFTNDGLYPGKEKFTPKQLSIKSGEEGTSTLIFEPKAIDKYKILVTANPTAAYLSETKEMELRVVDFSMWLNPGNQEAKEDDLKSWDIWIKNDLGKSEEFVLTSDCDGCTCTLSTDSVTVDDGDLVKETIECSSSELGEHEVSVTVESSTYGESKSDSVNLIVVKCWGDISLSVNSPVKSGDEVTVEVDGLIDCSGQQVWFAVDYMELEVGSCVVDGGGEGCSLKYSGNPPKANSPGNYVIYAMIDLDGGDYSDEEWDDADLTIGVDEPEDIGYSSKDFSNNLNWCNDGGGEDLTVTCVDALGYAKRYKTYVIECWGDCRYKGSANDICHQRYGDSWHAMTVDCETIEIDGADKDWNRDFDDDIDWCKDTWDEDMTVTCADTGITPLSKVVVIECDSDCGDEGSANDICLSFGDGWFASAVDCETIETGGDTNKDWNKDFDDDIDWCKDGGGEDMTVTCMYNPPGSYEVRVIECDGDCYDEASPDNICGGGWYASSVDCEEVKDESGPIGDCQFNVDMCNCENCLDPQSCKDFSPASVCCKSGEEEYYPGPPGVPCLSPDTKTGDQQTENMKWWGSVGKWGGDEAARNILIYDKKRTTYREDGLTSFCTADSDCKGGEDVLADAECDELKGFLGWCKLKGEYYNAWQLIRISESTRPVYGLTVRRTQTYPDPSSGDESHFVLFIHSNEEWELVGTWESIGSFSNEMFVPSEWAWEKADYILIGLYNPWGGTVNPPQTGGDIDYIGLLPKWSRMPYCTDGIDYGNRIVDDGKTCYWNVDCTPSGTWTGNPSTGLGPFLQSNVCDCDNTDTCGIGYCEDSGFCYHSVRCMNGGWFGILDKCSGSEHCTNQGCAE